MATPGFLEDYAKDYAAQSKATYSTPIDTSQFTGRQFVAGEDPLQTQAINLATSGVGAYQPFLTAAQAAQQQAAGTIGGLSGLTGASAYQPFMSPYQQQVIDTTLAEYDKQGFTGEQQIRDAAVMSGNFGGGREGAQLGQYQSDRLGDRAALQAQMLASGLSQAQQQAQQNFLNQGTIAGAQSGLGTAQMGLSNFQRAGLGADVGALGQLGSLRQGQAQSLLSADQQAAQTAAYEPYGRLSQYGTGLTGLSGGVASQPYAQPAPVSPMSQAIGTALGVGGLYGKIFGFPADKL